MRNTEEQLIDYYLKIVDTIFGLEIWEIKIRSSTKDSSKEKPI